MGTVRIVDVAREAGVSLGTVSNALNHPERVRPETRKLIEETIDRLGYLPNQRARLLAGGSNKVIGLVLPCLTHGCSVQIANGARNEAIRNGYDVLVLCVNGNAAYERRYLRFLAGMQVAAILIQPMDDIERHEELGLPMPVVYLGATDVPHEVLSVSADFRAQGTIVTEHVLAQGAERIAVIGAPDVPKRAERLEGVRSALEAHGFDDFEIIAEGRSEGSLDGARLGAMLAERADADRPDAVIAISDVLAAGAIAGIQARGLSVPDDIMVAGCDGNPLAWTGSVPITTCSPAGYELGRKGVKLALSVLEEDEAKRAARRVYMGSIAKVAGRLAAEDGRASRHENVRPFLLERASTGAGKADTSQGAASAIERLPELDIGSFL